LVQSHLGYIQLLPALPAAWKNGHVKGLVARGNFEIEMSWKDGKLSKAFITSRAGGKCILLTPGPASIKSNQQAIHFEFEQGSHSKQQKTSFLTQKGMRYEILVK